MNQLSIITMPDGMEAVDSREVAVAVGKQHKELLRDVRKYAEYLTESKIALSDFFHESTYKDSTGRELPCYLITRKGCDMIANKMTGQKGVVFTALYVNAFHDMHEHIQVQASEIQRMEAEARRNRAIAMRICPMKRRCWYSRERRQSQNIPLSAPGDSETCDICRALSGQRFKIKDRLPGTNFPPMHPWCRCFFDPVVPEVSAFLEEERKNTQIVPAAIRLTDSQIGGIIKTDKQFGKKIGKHAVDFGLDPSKEEDRKKMMQIIDSILNEPDEIRIGYWKSQVGDSLFYIRGDDAVVVNSGKFVTILKGGINNGKVKDARKC